MVSSLSFRLQSGRPTATSYSCGLDSKSQSWPWLRPMNRGHGVWVFLVFIIIQVFSLYVALVVPETKKWPIDEITALSGNRDDLSSRRETRVGI